MLRLFAFSVVFFSGVFLPAAEVVLPWNVLKARQRQVFEIRPAGPVKTLSVEIPIEGNAVLESGDGRLRFVDAVDQEKPLSFFKDDKAYHVVLDRECGPDRPGRLIAYRGEEVEPSPQLDVKPEIVDDYASSQLETPWDFQDGKTTCITGWGVGPEHYGKVTVDDGWLRIPILGNDPYFIFGVMWGGPADPKALKIDSSVYRFLEIRLRQSCDEAFWRFYVTDDTGAYRQVDFSVRGKEPQVFRFDLSETFPDFWDGRLFRAVRIDPIKNRPQTTAEVDYVRILPGIPVLLAGPSFSRKACDAREKTRRLDVTVPGETVAGDETPVSIMVRNENEKPLRAGMNLPWTTKTNTVLAGSSTTGDDGSLAVKLPVENRAGTVDWTVGIPDDLGEPMFAVRGRIAVKPAELSAYRLQAREFVDVAGKEPHEIKITGMDRFGNPIPVDIRNPRWTAGSGASIVDPASPLRGETATVHATLSDSSPVRHRLNLTDENGLTGSVEMTTVAYRKERIRLNENGYMVEPDGGLYYPVGGLYANWPHGNPDEKGSLVRSLDLFPCDNIPYKHGFPWPADVEKKVVDYLDHCKSHGLNTLRLMLRNMDIVGRVDPVQLEAVLHYFDLARERGIKFNVVLFEDYRKPPYSNQAILENLVLPHYSPEQLAALPPHRARFLVQRRLLKSAETRYGDPDVLECHKDYLRELIPVLAGRDEVLNYEFENEMYLQPIAWCREIAKFIRSIDPHTMILADPHPLFWPKPIPWRECAADLIAYHPYNNGQAGADMGSVFFYEAKMAARIGLPFNTGEGGVYDGQIPYEKDCLEQRVLGARDQIWMNLCAGGNGFLYWTVMHEKIIAEFGKIAPVMKTIGIDLKNMQRKRADVAVVMPPYEEETITWSHGGAEYNRRCKDFCMRFLALGVDFDITVQGEDDDYPVRFDVMKTDPASILSDGSFEPTVARPGAGWDLAALRSADEQTAVLYLRNIAGGIEDFGTENRACYCRVPKAAEATVRLRQPDRWKTVTVYDLDSGASKEIRPDKDGILRLGDSKSDFVIGLRHD